MHDMNINIGAIKRAKRMTGVDLFDIISEPDPTPGGEGVELSGLGQLSTDPGLLVDVCYAILHPALTEAGIDDLQFGETLTGPAFAALRASFFKELGNFFESGGRPDQAIAIYQMLKTETSAIARSTRAMKAIDTEKIVSDAASFGTSFTSTPESVDLTPTPSPSAN